MGRYPLEEFIAQYDIRRLVLETESYRTWLQLCRDDMREYLGTDNMPVDFNQWVECCFVSRCARMIASEYSATYGISGSKKKNVTRIVEWVTTHVSREVSFRRTVIDVGLMRDPTTRTAYEAKGRMMCGRFDRIEEKLRRGN